MQLCKWCSITFNDEIWAKLTSDALSCVLYWNVRWTRNLRRHLSENSLFCSDDSDDNGTFRSQVQLQGEAKAILLCQWPGKDAQLVPCTNGKGTGFRWWRCCGCLLWLQVHLEVNLTIVSQGDSLLQCQCDSQNFKVQLYALMSHVYHDCIKKTPANKHPKPCFIPYHWGVCF